MKIKMPKLPQFPRRRKLRATTARRAFATTASDYEEMSEPNMKLSRALLIVLVLHIVAVAGIIAFNAIKTRQSSVPMSEPVASESSTPVGSTTKPVASPPAKPVALEKAVAVHDEIKPAHAVAKDEHRPEHAKPNEKPGLSADGKTYVVAKGENPVTIAKKLKVSYDDLLAINHIDDPRKLQIGQKLLVPKKIAKAKKADE
jgi:LysM repeat protein